MKQRALSRELTMAHRREKEREGKFFLMSAAHMEQVFADERLVRNPNMWSVLALIFTMPTSEAVRSLSANGETLDLRSGSTWDLFFAGYYRSSEHTLEDQVGSRAVGGRWTDDWYFNDHEFDKMRRFVEESTDFAWRWSGGTDLVLLNVLIPAKGPAVVDWESVQSGALTDAADGTNSLNLLQVVANISDELERDLGDPAYGVASVVDPQVKSEDSIPKKVMIGALAGIAAVLGKDALGL